MATTPSIYYPTGDGRPMAETPIHGDALIHLVDALKQWFTQEPNVYIGRNMMLYYVEGDPRKHVSPDAFVTLGIPKDTPRDAYFTWLEGGRGPDIVVEITSKSTRNEDVKKKYTLYQDVLQVHEYYLFDPRGEYLKPPLQGYRLEDGHYLPITEAAGRLPSEVLDLHFEADGQTLRLYDPTTGEWLPTEAEAQRRESEAQRREADAQRREADAQREVRIKEHEIMLQEREARQRAEHEVERLRERLQELERQGRTGGGN